MPKLKKSTKFVADAFGSDDDTSTPKIKINQNYAKSFEERKKKEEYQKGEIENGNW